MKHGKIHGMGGMGGYGKFKINERYFNRIYVTWDWRYGPLDIYSKRFIKCTFNKISIWLFLSEKNYVQLGGAVPNSEDNIRLVNIMKNYPQKSKSKMDGVMEKSL